MGQTMKVLYDFQAFESVRFGGVSRYFVELMKSIQQHDFHSVRLAIKYFRNEHLKTMDAGSQAVLVKPAKDYFEQANFWKKGAVNSLLNYGLNGFKKYQKSNLDYSRQMLNQKSEYDLFHPTYYNPYFLDIIGNKPYIATVYDMIHEIYPEYFPLNEKTRVKKKTLVERASFIIAISQNTKQDLMKLYGIDDSKIRVIHLSNSLRKQKRKAVASLPDTYLLFVGNRHTYKNFYFFLRSVLPVLENHPELMIVCTGRPLSLAEKDYFKQLGLQGRIIHKSGDDTLLAALYSNALAFVFPSLYEGFGIPILEAFACECPAILSNTSSFPEVGGDAARYFEPKDPISIRKAVEEVINHEDLRKELVRKGLERLKLFSWDLMARETLAVYREVLSGVACR